MGDGYVKIYGDRLLNSSLHLERWQPRLLFVEMLAMADRYGWVNTPSERVLAQRANLSLDDTRAGLAVLEAPDPESRTPTDDGRRLVRKQGGWQIVNYEHYRDFRTEKQEADRVRAAEKRARQVADVGDKSQSQRQVALPVAVVNSESLISDLLARARTRGDWTSEVQHAVFVHGFEETQQTIPSMAGRHVATFHADVVRTAERQKVTPVDLFVTTLVPWLLSGLSDAALRAPYACFQQAWGQLTARGPRRQESRPGRLAKTHGTSAADFEDVPEPEDQLADLKRRGLL